MSDEKPVTPLIPLWLAVAITVFTAMPFGLWLGKYNFTLWVSFIVWAEYFALGAKPAVLKLIVPSYCAAAILTAGIVFLFPILSFLPSIRTPGDLSTSLVLAAGVGVLVFAMRWSTTLQNGALPYFNGMTMTLAVFFSGSYPKIASSALAPLEAGVWAVLMGMFGALLGVVNVWLTFPRESRASVAAGANRVAT